MKLLTINIILMLFSIPGLSQLADASADIAAEYCLKVGAWEKGIAGGGDVTIYVLDNPAIAQELTKSIGKKIGKSVLMKVEEGSTLPADKPNILFIGNPTRVAESIKYSRDNNVLSVTHSPGLVWEGVTLGLGIERLKTRIVLNLSSSIDEELNWNPAIMKVARTVK